MAKANDYAQPRRVRDTRHRLHSDPENPEVADLTERPSSAMTLSENEFDLVFEGKPERVTDQVELERLATIYGQGDWHPEVENAAFTAEPFGATRWTSDRRP